jgi:hypothetical protein
LIVEVCLRSASVFRPRGEGFDTFFRFASGTVDLHLNHPLTLSAAPGFAM